MKKLLYILLFIGFIAGSTAAPKAPFNKGVNFSNWFQESSVNLVGFTKYTKQDFINVKGMGADAIRLPVNFYAMTSGSPDYIVSPLLFTMLDTVVAWAEKEEMYLILDNHSHDPSFNAHPDLKNILSKMWIQIADHYKDRSRFVLYEIINEPAGFTDAVWADMMQSVVASIRTVDTVHTIVISPLEWSGYGKLNSLPMFEDKNLLYTIHFYGPFLFTHQGANWVGLDSLKHLPFPYGASPMPALPSIYKGTWIENDLNIYNTGGTIKRVKEQIGIAAKFATTRNVPLWCGEFGVYSPNVIPEQRIFWYDTVSKILESQGIAWTIWGYHYAFGIFNTTTWGSFEHDVNIPMVEALGFKAPAQTPYVKRTESSELVIYDDYLAPGIHNVSLVSGQVNMYNEKQPATGRYSISATKFKMQDAISLLFLKDKDLSELKDQGYALEFKLRTGYVGKFAVRFLDTKTSATDRPWRAQATVTVNTASPSKDWQTISIPLSSFKDAGAWDAKWYSPEGKFDWTAIEKFEISASFASFGDTVLYFDQIRIRIPGSPEPEIVAPVTPSTPSQPDAGLIEPIIPAPEVIPPTEVVVVPEPKVTPPTEVVVVPEPVVTPPTEVVVVPEPEVTPPTEVVVVPEPEVTPPTEVVVVPEPEVIPPTEVVVVPEPEVTPPTEGVVVPEPEATPPTEVVVVPEPEVTPPTEVVVVPEPVVTPPTEVVVVPEPEATPPTEVVVVPEPEVIPPTEVVVVPEPEVIPPTEVVVVPEPEVTPPTEVVVVPEPEATPPTEVVIVPEPEVTLPTEVVVVPEPEVTPPTEVVVVPEPEVTPPTEVVVVPEPEATPPTEVVVVPEPEVTPPTEVVEVPEPIIGTPEEGSPEQIVEHDSIVTMRPEEILEPKPNIDLPNEQQIEQLPVAVDPDIEEPVTGTTPVTEPVVAVPDDETIIPDLVPEQDTADEINTEDPETTELILIPKTIGDVPVEVVITLQPAPDVPDIEEVEDGTYIEDAVLVPDTDTITEGTGDFVPIVDNAVPETDTSDTIRVDVTIVETPDGSLTDSSLGEGTGYIKQMVTTSEAEKRNEPYSFVLDKGWLIVKSQQEVKVISILDASLRLMRKEEGTNKILLDLPSGNYFVIVKFADGKEIIESAHF